LRELTQPHSSRLPGHPGPSRAGPPRPTTMRRVPQSAGHRRSPRRRLARTSRPDAPTPGSPFPTTRPFWPQARKYDEPARRPLARTATPMLPAPRARRPTTLKTWLPRICHTRSRATRDVSRREPTPIYVSHPTLRRGRLKREYSRLGETAPVPAAIVHRPAAPGRPPPAEPTQESLVHRSAAPSRPRRAR
jgi:hypothetical protein